MLPLLVATLALLIAPGCGRKNSSFLNFNKSKPAVKVNPLTLPAVRGLTAARISDEIVEVCWQPVINPAMDLQGYNLYRFVRTAFIPKKPLNKEPIQDKNFRDNLTNKKDVAFCYVVRPVFKIEGKNFEGPLSQVVCIE